MNIHLIKTPEISDERYFSLIDYLSNFKGPLNYTGGLSNSSFHKQTPLFDNILNNKYFSFEDFSLLCNSYRSFADIPKESVTVLLTSVRNVSNWFSYFDTNRNVLIHTDDWEHYVNADEKYPIAYEIAQNVLQSISGVNIDLDLENYAHFDPIGCMSDFCGSKKDIILKLRTGDICINCLDKLNQCGIDEEIINQTIEIFESVRSQLLFKNGFRKNIKPKVVKIDARGNIEIGDSTMQLNPLESTLFIFFLLIGKGISLNDLNEYKSSLLNIYLQIRPNGDEGKIDKLIKPKGMGTFPKNKSSLNKKLREQLGEPLVNFYCIEGMRGGSYHISLPSEYIVSEISL